MRIFLTLLLGFVLFAKTQAQTVWTEGTYWEIEYYVEPKPDEPEQSAEPVLHKERYQLEPAIVINNTNYFPLTRTKNGETQTLAYIRSERGDTLVYVLTEASHPERLLYDFSKSFEPGDCIYLSDELDASYSEPILAEEISYYYNVLEPGDCLPCWRTLIYKLGYIEGPLSHYLLLESSSNDGEPDATEGDDDHPKPTNVSHLLFGTKSGSQSSLTPSGIIEIFAIDPNSETSLQLDGTRYDGRQNSIFIHRGRKYILLRR